MIVLKRRRPQATPAQITRGKCVGIAETVSGTLDNNNQVYTTSNDYIPGSISLSYNGQLFHNPDDFLETGSNEITLIYIKPHVEDVLRAMYEYDDCIGADSANGKQPLLFGSSSQYVAFVTVFPDTNYVITTNLTNETDVDPSLYPAIVSSKTVSGFTVQFSGDMDSDNYVLEWVAMGL